MLKKIIVIVIAVIFGWVSGSIFLLGLWKHSDCHAFLWKKDAAKVMDLEVRALTKLMEMNDQTDDPYFTQHYGDSAYEERAPLLDIAEIHAFNEAHLTLNEYASLSGGIYKARCRLRRLGTKPIAPKSILLRYVYRKSDIESLPV
ncbi:hypothetical protein [Yoonia sp. MH D7]